MSLTFSIITPEEVFLTCKTNRIILPSPTGDLGILPGHAPLITVVGPGLFKFEQNGSFLPLVLYDGIVEIKNNAVTVLVRGLEEIPTTIKLERLEEEVQKSVSKLLELKNKMVDLKIIKKAVLETKVAKARIAGFSMLK